MARIPIGPVDGAKVVQQSVASFNNEMGEVSKTTSETQSATSGPTSGRSKTHGTSLKHGNIVVHESDSGAEIVIDNAKASFLVSESGHITVKSQSGSGVTVQSTAGPVAVEGIDVVVKSSGNMSIDSGGDLNLNAKGARALRNRLANAPHPKDTQAAASQAPPQKPGWRPTRPLARLHHAQTFRNPARHA